MEAYITRKELSQKTGFTQSQIKQWTLRKENPMPHYRITQNPLYRESEVLDWLSKQKG